MQNINTIIVNYQKKTKGDDIMDIIEFNLDDLKNQNTGFSYYILGRSYDLEENDAIEDYRKALEYYLKGLNID